MADTLMQQQERAVSQQREHRLDSLIDALDAVIDGGAAIAGDVVISVAGVELIQLDLRALLMSVSDRGDEVT